MPPVNGIPEEGLGGIEPRPSDGPAGGLGTAATGSERLPAATLATTFVLVLLGAMAIVLVPRIVSSAPTSPPVGLVLGVGLGVTAISSAALYVVLAVRARFWVRAVIFALLSNAVITLVVFAVWPEALHAYTLNRAITPNDFSRGVVLVGIISFLLSAVVALVIYWVASRRMLRVLEREFARPVLLVGLFLFLGSVALVASVLVSYFIANGVPFAAVAFGGVFGPSIVVGLVASVIIEAIAFKTAGDQAIKVRDASILASFFWVALAILAGYHIAWVVYALWLTSAWPLKAPSGGC
jgi:hypothetical protein